MQPSQLLGALTLLVSAAAASTPAAASASATATTALETTATATAAALPFQLPMLAHTFAVPATPAPTPLALRTLKRHPKAKTHGGDTYANAAEGPAPAPTKAFKRAPAPAIAAAAASTLCPTSYHACAALGAPGLCCRADSNCAVDQAGHVACCPSRAVCTGSLTGLGSSTVEVSVSTMTDSASLSSATTTQGFVAVDGTTVATPNRAGFARGVEVGGWVGVFVGVVAVL